MNSFFKKVFFSTLVGVVFSANAQNININVNGDAQVSVSTYTTIADNFENKPTHNRYNPEYKRIQKQLDVLKHVRHFYEPCNIFNFSQELIDQVNQEILINSLIVGEEIYTDYDTIPHSFKNDYPYSPRLSNLTHLYKDLSYTGLNHERLNEELKKIIFTNLVEAENVYSAKLYAQYGIKDVTEKELAILSSLHSLPSIKRGDFSGEEAYEFATKQINFFYELKGLTKPKNILGLENAVIDDINTEINIYKYMAYTSVVKPEYKELSDKEQLKLMEKVFLQSNQIDFILTPVEWQFKALLGINLSRLQDKLGVPNIVTNLENRQKALEKLNKIEEQPKVVEEKLEDKSQSTVFDTFLNIMKVILLLSGIIFLVVVSYIKIKTYKAQQKVKEDIQ